MTKRAILLEALASTPADVERLTRALDETAAVWRPEPDSWSCHDVLSHLCGMELLYLAHLRRILAENEPSLPALHSAVSRAADEAAWATRDIMQLAEQFRMKRATTLAFLQALPPAAWQRAAFHEGEGRMTLRFFVQDLVNHDIEHTNQLVEIQQRRRASLKSQASAALLSGGMGE